MKFIKGASYRGAPFLKMQIDWSMHLMGSFIDEANYLIFANSAKIKCFSYLKYIISINTLTIMKRIS